MDYAAAMQTVRTHVGVQLTGLLVVSAALLVANYLHNNTIVGVYLPLGITMLILGGAVGLVLRQLPPKPVGDGLIFKVILIVGVGLGIIDLLQQI